MVVDKHNQPLCVLCYDPIPKGRADMNHVTCIPCQEIEDRKNPQVHTVTIGFNKGAYQYVHNPDDLRTVHKK